MSDLLLAEDVTHAVGRTHLLRDVEVSAGAGELLAIVGPNGAGKSTLLGILAGDIRPTSGRIVLRGQDLRSISTAELARERAVMRQHTALSFPFTVDDIVAMGRYPCETDRARDVLAIARAMRLCDVEHLAERAFPSLSGGEQQRVTFARVLAQEAPILLLDEPTSSLDLRHQEHVMTVARSVADEGGAVIAVLHDLDLAAWYADRVCLLADGSVVADGPPELTLTDDLLSAAYGCRITTSREPATGVLLIRPARGGDSPRCLGASQATRPPLDATR